MRQLLKIHLGSPVPALITRGAGRLVTGRSLIRFPVDITKLLRYINSKREETGVDITMTHIAVRAAATAVMEMPSVNGHVLFSQFFRSTDDNVDVSVSVDLSETETVMLKIEDSDSKPVEFIASELQSRSRYLFFFLQ